MARSELFAALLLLLAATTLRQAAAQSCNATFLDALEGSDAWLFLQGLNLAGYASKLPNPEIGVTILVPNNEAWLRFLWRNGFLLCQLGDLGDKLLAVMTFHIIPMAISPNTLANTHEGSVPTLYGLLTSQSADLKHWPKFDDGQFLFQGPWDDTIAGVTGEGNTGAQVCNSWVYVVDEVLKPAYDLNDVQDVEIPNISFGDNSTSSPSPSPRPSPSTTAASPTPTSSPAAPSSPAPPTCDKSFAQVAGETSGLGLLKTILSQEAYASVLPDPSFNYTLFAPTDAAFFDLLKTFNLSVAGALSLGDKLNAMLLYHVVPGALTPEQLKLETMLTTGLALKTDNGGYTITINAFGQNTTVNGNYAGNTANLLSSLPVCSSQVYVVDKVLIPAGSLDAIPAVSGGLDPEQGPATAVASSSPSPTPFASPPASSPATALVVPEAETAPITSVLGVALATGYLEGCTVQLSSAGGTQQTTTTDGSGRFSFTCSSDCDGETTALLASGQPLGCGDTLTQLPPPYDLAAPVSALPKGITLAALDPLTTIIAAANAQIMDQPAPPLAAGPSIRKLLQRNGADAVVAAVTVGRRQRPRRSLLAGFDFGIASDNSGTPTNVSTYYGNALEAAMEGNQGAYDLLSKNQELVCTGGIGSSLLATLVGGGGGTTNASAAAAVFHQLAQDLLAGSPFDLTDAAAVQQLYQDTLAELVAAVGEAPPPTSINTTAVMAAAAETVTLLNSLLQRAVTAAQESQLVEAGKMVQVLVRLAKVCQSDVAPKASQLGAGLLSVDAWKQEFSLQAITNLTMAETLS